MTDTSPLAVRVAGLTKRYGSGDAAALALRGIDLEVRTGELLMLVGPSGCGKTTLISVLAGIMDKTDGTVDVLGVDPGALPVDDRTRWRGANIGFVFQAFNLMPALTAAENVSIPLLIRNVPQAEALRRARAMLERVELAHRVDSLPAQLSGGQQQRVAIARALVNAPQLILADEPTGALDSHTSLEIMALLQELNRGGMTIVLVTHEHDVAAYAGRLIGFRDGRVLTDTRNSARDAAADLAALTVPAAA